ncbi:acid-soluble spore protein N [Heyndrickxia acidiproducens]|jgi:small acid-soluble spore protein N (minor)|nr:acid-soluble spore protein N [Heyndrickxia acidiproducens]
MKLGNPNKKSKYFTPDHLGTQPRGFSGNNGKKMQDRSGEHAQVIQTKGE